MGYRLVSLDEFDHQQLTHFWNRAFTGHVSDFQKNQEVLALRLHQGNADGEMSLILMEKNRFAGLSIFGRLGNKGEILGFGIDPEYRGRALARRLIKRHVKQLSSLGLDQLGLEVAARNHAARRAYEGAGFRATRELLFFSGPITHKEPLAFLPAAAAAKPLPVQRSSLAAFPAQRLRLSGRHHPSFDRSFGFWSAHPVPPEVRLAGSPDAPEAMMATRLIEGNLEIVDAIGSREGLAALLLDALTANPGWSTLTCSDEPAGSPLALLLKELGVPEVTRWTEMVVKCPGEVACSASVE